MNALWQSKRVLKTGPNWQKPKWLSNRPKDMSLEDWQTEVAEWKLNKLIVLDKVPKTKRKEFTAKDE
jgi:hypothetical protein